MLDFVMQPAVLTVLIALAVIAIGFWGRKQLNVFRLVFKVWHWVEKASMLAGWEGYEKLAWAMEEFSARFYEAFGREPAPGDEGWAVKILTWLCRIEDKEAVEDFSVPLPEVETA